MTATVQAVYEGGVFRPTRKLSLTEGTQVDVLIPQAHAPRDPHAVAAALTRIAAQAPRRGRTESTSANHDQFLYGRKQQP